PVDAMMTCGAMMADDARAMHGEHPAAASSSDKGSPSDKGLGGIDGRIVVVVGVIVRIVVVIDAADKHSMEMMMMPVAERPADKSGASRNRGRACAQTAPTN